MDSHPHASATSVREKLYKYRTMVSHLAKGRKAVNGLLSTRSDFAGRKKAPPSAQDCLVFLA